MNPSYVRIRLPIAEAMPRFAGWIGLPEAAAPKEVASSSAVSEASDNGAWRSAVAVFVHPSEGWTVFDDLTGHLASFSADRWRGLARQDELVYAGYNDAVPYGQLIVVRGGMIVREFLDDRQDPRQNVNRGRLSFEGSSPINDWIGAASFVDGDGIAPLPETGLLWLFG